MGDPWNPPKQDGKQHRDRYIRTKARECATGVEFIGHRLHELEQVHDADEGRLRAIRGAASTADVLAQQLGEAMR